jgi:hypothetical protein
MNDRPSRLNGVLGTMALLGANLVCAGMLTIEGAIITAIFRH